MTSLDVENFSKGLMCLSTSGNHTQFYFIHNFIALLFEVENILSKNEKNISCTVIWRVSFDSICAHITRMSPQRNTLHLLVRHRCRIGVNEVNKHNIQRQVKCFLDADYIFYSVSLYIRTI